MSLYEGTNGIQAIDLMGRKMTVNEGACLRAFKKELRTFCNAHSNHPGLGSRVQALNSVAENLFDNAGQMIKLRRSDRLQWASYTYPALKAFGEVTMVWRLLDLAIVAYERSLEKGSKSDYYRAKIHQATYYTDTTLPHTLATIKSCLRSGREIIETPLKAF